MGFIGAPDVFKRCVEDVLEDFKVFLGVSRGFRSDSDGLWSSRLFLRR